MDEFKSIIGGGLTGLMVGAGIGYLINRAINATKKYDSIGCVRCRNIIGSDENWRLGFRCQCVPLYCKIIRAASHQYESSNFMIRREALTDNVFGYGIVYGPIMGLLICHFSPTVGSLLLICGNILGALILELFLGGDTKVQRAFFMSYGGLIGIVCTIVLKSINFCFSKTE
jgi:F0F1-type ATP synthase assembly protein I